MKLVKNKNKKIYTTENNTQITPDRTVACPGVDFSSH